MYIFESHTKEPGLHHIEVSVHIIHRAKSECVFKGLEEIALELEELIYVKEEEVKEEI